MTTSPSAQDKAQQTAATAADEGKKVAGTAKAEAGKVAAEARTQLSSLVDEAGSQVADQSRTQRDRLVSTLHSVSNDLDQMANRSDGSGVAASLVRQVSEGARSLGDHMDGREPTDLMDDVRRFARRRPGTFLLGALAAGVVAGRLTRGAKAAKDGSTGTTDRSTTTVMEPVSTPGNVFGDSPAAPVSPAAPAVPAPLLEEETPAYTSPGLANPGPPPVTGTGADPLSSPSDLSGRDLS